MNIIIPFRLFQY